MYIHFVSVYVYIYIYICNHMYIYIYVKCLHLLIYIYTHTEAISIHVYVHICIYIYIHIHKRAFSGYPLSRFGKKLSDDLWVDHDDVVGFAVFVEINGGRLEKVYGRSRFYHPKFGGFLKGGGTPSHPPFQTMGFSMDFPRKKTPSSELGGTPSHHPN